MALDIMSGPPLPSRKNSSIRGRPLPSAPSNEAVRNRALPSLPVEQHVTAKPPSLRGPRYVGRQEPDPKSRPLPPPPDNLPDSSQIDTKTLRRDLPPVPNGTAAPTSTNTGTLKRPLPPPPTEDTQPKVGGNVLRRPSNLSNELPPQLPVRRPSINVKQISFEEGRNVKNKQYFEKKNKKTSQFSGFFTCIIVKPVCRCHFTNNHGISKPMSIGIVG